MSCKGPDFSGVNFFRGVRRGGTEGIDTTIYAAPDCPDSGSRRAWCINCGQSLNWLNNKIPFLCSLCQKREAEGLVILATRPEINIVGIPANDAFNEPGLGVVVKFFRNGGLKIKNLE